MHVVSEVVSRASSAKRASSHHGDVGRKDPAVALRFFARSCASLKWNRSERAPRSAALPSDPRLRLQQLLTKAWADLRESTPIALKLDRTQLMDRLELEAKMLQGLKLLLLCIGIFACNVTSLIKQADSTAVRGLERTFTKAFALDETKDIATEHTLNEYLVDVLHTSHELLPTSSNYFATDGSDSVRLFSGIETFSEPRAVTGQGIAARIDSPSFTLTAWRKTHPENSIGAFIVRKPLGQSVRGRQLTCWGWYFGDTPSLVFGAHDFIRPAGAPLETLSNLTLAQHVVRVPPASQTNGTGALWTHASGEPERLHLESLVVNATHAAFYQDARLVAMQPIPRHVTDCSGSTLEMGGSNFQIGDITFHAMAFDKDQLYEIMYNGNLLANIASGKGINAPSMTPFDRLNTESTTTLANHQNDREALRETLMIDNVLTWAATDQPQARTPAPPANTSATPLTNCSRTWPTCNVISGVNETLTADALLTNHQYYRLLPERPDGSGTRVTLVPGEWVHYDVPSFPRWRGTSVTFTAWVRTQSSGYLIAKSPSKDASPRCWTFHQERNGLASIGGATVDGYQHPYSTVLLPTAQTFAFEAMTGFRHIAQVFDAADNSLRAYIDGEFIGESPFPAPDDVARLDCDNGPETYIGLGHRSPGGGANDGEVEDMRMYVGAALSSEEIRQLAFAAGTSRICATPSEPGDSATFRDERGHGCSWYQALQEQHGVVCSAQTVRAACSVACGLSPPCLQNVIQQAAPITTEHNLWPKINLISARGQDGVLCPRTDLDLVSRCHAWKASNTTQVPHFWSWASWGAFRSYVLGQGATLMDAADCDRVLEHVSTYCSFKPLPVAINADINTNGGFTVSFWLKATDARSLTQAQLKPTVTFYSSVSPPRPLLNIYTRTSGLIFAQAFGRCSASELEDASVAGPLLPSKWNHITIVVSRMTVMLMVNGVHSTQDHQLWPEWCQEPSSVGVDRLIQAVYLSHTVTISGVEIDTRPLSERTLQQRFYRERTLYELRRGPIVSNFAREKSRIPYSRVSYSSTTFLGAPLLVETRRAVASTDCEQGSFGRQAHERVHQFAKQTRCHGIYNCGNNFTADEFLSCANPRVLDRRHFGRNVNNDHFTEFLASIVEAPYLIRANDIYATRDFIDRQTLSVDVLAVAIASQFGVASLIDIKAKLGATVTVTFDIQSIRSIETDDLSEIQSILAIGFGLVVLATIDLIFRSWRMRKRRHRYGRSSKDGHASRVNADTYIYLLVDLFTLVLVPVIFFVWQWVLVENTGESLGQFVNMLQSIPWADTNVDWNQKLHDYEHSLDAFKLQFVSERWCRMYGFVSGLTLLMRMIYATSAHPRVAVLVETVRRAIDDIWHALIIVAIVLVGFMFLGFSQFGTMDDFSSVTLVFINLYSILVGGMKSGVPEDNFLVLFFIVLFSLVAFFLVINLVIAIIVEAYLKVRTKVEDLKADDEFFHDVGMTLLVLVKRRINGWPSDHKLLLALESCRLRALGPRQMMVVMPDWEDQCSVTSFFGHYKQWHSFMRPENNPPSRPEPTLPQVVDDLEKRIAIMVASKPTTSTERLNLAPKKSRISSAPRGGRASTVAAEASSRVRTSTVAAEAPLRAKASAVSSTVYLSSDQVEISRESTRT